MKRLAPNINTTMRDLTADDRWALKLIQKALKGNVAAIREILETVFGPAQIEHGKRRQPKSVDGFCIARTTSLNS